MAKGINQFLEAAKNREANYERKEYAKELWPALKEDGSSVNIRFLDTLDEISGGYFHSTQVNGRWTKFLCLDQEGDNPDSCPACVAGVQKTFKGFINVLWYDAPILARDNDGKAIKKNGDYVIEGYEDVNAVWEQGITVFKNLHTLSETYDGINKVDFRILRSGTGKQTQYNVLPLPGEPQEVDAKFLENKYDLNEFVTPPDASKMQEVFLPSQGAVAASTGTPAEASPFTRKNRFE